MYYGPCWITFRFNIVMKCDSLDELHVTLSKLILAFVFAGFDVPLRCNKLQPQFPQVASHAGVPLCGGPVINCLWFGRVFFGVAIVDAV